MILDDLFPEGGGVVENIRNRTQWALEMMYSNGRVHDAFAVFPSKETAVEHQLEVLDALCKDYLSIRGKI